MFNDSPSNRPGFSMECAFLLYCHYIQNHVALKGRFKGVAALPKEDDVPAEYPLRTEKLKHVLTRSFVKAKGIGPYSISRNGAGGHGFDSLMEGYFKIKKVLPTKVVDDQDQVIWKRLCPKEYLFSTFFEKFIKTENRQNDFIQRYNSSTTFSLYTDIVGSDEDPYGEEQPIKESVFEPRAINERMVRIMESIDEPEVQKKIKDQFREDKTNDGNEDLSETDLDEQAQERADKLHEMVEQTYKIKKRYNFNKEKRNEFLRGAKKSEEVNTVRNLAIKELAEEKERRRRDRLTDETGKGSKANGSSKKREGTSENTAKTDKKAKH